MSAPSRSNLLLGLFFAIAAIILIFVWIPLDTDTGLIQKVRGRFNIGDALAPTVAAGFLLVGGLILILTERDVPDQPTVTVSHLIFICSLAATVILSVLVMRYAGPVAVEITNLFRDDPLNYRILRATPGWMHIGFVLGGVLMVTGIVSIVERKITRRAVLTGLFAVILLIAVFDLPFDDLVLPPNGDV